MTRSMNEVMALATKAARGAGAPPAQAALFGAAAVAHLANGKELQDLHSALAALPDGPIISLPLDITRVAETARAGKATGRAAAGRTALLQSYISTLPYQAELSQGGGIHLDLTKPAARIAVRRIDLPADINAQWSALAARLLVPESEASRLSGAGAGLSDND
ncbi:hypothetical protein [Sulfitobacter sp.]|uniref:hypothetical protein n=1 Tax=Sulfitobacter sp. TaxID=1903071 RepID=UPI0030029395